METQRNLRALQEQALVFARTAIELGVNSKRGVNAQIRLKYFDHDAANRTLVPSVADRNHLDSKDPIPIDEGIEKGLVICKAIKNKAAVTEDLSNWDGKKFPGISEWVPIKSIVAIPLRNKDRIAAVVAVDCNENFRDAFKNERNFINAVQALATQLELVLTFYEESTAFYSWKKDMLSVDELSTLIAAANNAIDLGSKLSEKFTSLLPQRNQKILEETGKKMPLPPPPSIQLDDSNSERIAISFGGKKVFFDFNNPLNQPSHDDIRLLCALNKKAETLYDIILEIISTTGQGTDAVANAKEKINIQKITTETSACINQIRNLLKKIGIDPPTGYLDPIESAITITKS